MKLKYLLLAAAFACPVSAYAEDATPAKDGQSETAATQTAQPTKRAFTTGVARGRDLLDSAISTSALDEAEIEKFAPRSVSEIFRNIPGMRSEAYAGEGYSSISIRGLPIALGGAKFLQLQEDGMPVLEFGDIGFGQADQFLRADLTLSQVQAIRGGSASTFSSNSPGGVINLISKTGEEQGGAVELTTGLDYETYRMDFDYGGKLSDSVRFNVGGFYRQGEGPRATGYDAYKGGQLKFNITKTFDGGYIRLYAKFLDDKSPNYSQTPLRVTGTNADPHYANVAGFDARSDTMYSRYLPSNISMNENNQLTRYDYTDGMHSKVKSVGGEAQFELGEWTINERFRYSDISGAFRGTFLAPSLTGPASVVMGIWGGPGATLSYANGPNAGQVIANPSTLNGNGLVSSTTLFDADLNDLSNVTNDFRASRVWDLAGGKLTTTVGFYKAGQTIDTTWHFSSVFQEVKGGGEAAMLNLTSAGGVPLTQNGFYGFASSFFGNTRRNIYDVNYSVNAPYASLNYHAGKLAIGGSIRYDFGTARGQVFGADLGGGRKGLTSYDVNGDGVISAAETRVAIYPLTTPAPVNYDYDYLSYSLGVNYRIAEQLSVFGRYSRGGRANADRILYSNFISPTDGSLVRKDAAYDPVTQAEGGLKFRGQDAELYVTGFWAKTKEHNIGLDRSYRAYGVELEGSIKKGPFRLNAGATYTKAKITADALVAATVGNVPKHQADLIFQATPQFETERFTIGANFVGTTSSYAGDNNALKLPGYTLVNGFAQYRLTDRVQLTVNANNLFNKLAIIDAQDTSLPATGIVQARVANGRTVSASVRFDF
ncbi:TonB-dependent receptor [Novosphingobium sp. G106]|uniref:TonB-dependent siderophore receptor n=1 Tax=Novosphingobium sp. G106 TaxID=2849500 RepID=UPI001C2D0C7D|nr:TonB-dependent receptor [Novosphingobium sp. G106]MBV1691011.1 TonB-dependent receptor [Novosphingobium sp. G106]